MQERLVLEDPLLGSPVAEYRRSRGGLLITFLLVTGLFGYFAWWSAQQTPPSNLGLLFSIGFILFFVVLSILNLFFSEERIILFENGMRSYYLTHTKIILWQDFETVHFDAGSYNGVVHISINIRYSNGQKYRTAAVLWSSNEQIEEPKPGEILQIGVGELFECFFNATYEYRLEKALHTYDAGERIDFGKFQLSRDGLHVKNETLTWNDVADIDTDGSIMVVKQGGREQPWKVLPIEQVPNEDLIPDIIDHSQGTKYSAFLTDSEPREVLAIQGQRKWRGRFVRWVLIPSLIIGIPLGIDYIGYVMSGQANYDRGRDHLEAGNFAAAITEYTQAIDRDPSIADWYVDRGIAYRELGEFDKALADYAMALQLEPDHWDAIVHRGRVFYRRGEYHRAIADYDYVIARHPNYYYAYCTRAFSYKQLGKIQKTIVDFTACHDLTTLERWKIRANEEIQALHGHAWAQIPQFSPYKVIKENPIPPYQRIT